MKMKEKVKAAVVDILDELIEAELLKWPPDCAGILYQPERPESVTKEKE